MSDTVWSDKAMKGKELPFMCTLDASLSRLYHRAV